MNILDTLKLPIFSLPRKSNAQTFPAFLKKLFKEFLQAIVNIDEGTITDEIKANRKKIKNVCNLIIKSATTYYAGFPSRAYNEFEEAMTIIEDFLILQNVGIVFSELTPYYRARKGDGKRYQRHEMFHIPFEHRERVTTQRYSVPGLPCLYLSNSIYVCWEELRRPDINKMQISRCKLENMRYKFLDISLTPSLMCTILEEISSKESAEFSKQTQKEALDSWNKGSLNFIMRRPLIAACSIKVNKEDGAFKPEYIFPQFLMQWINENEISCVQYISTQLQFNHINNNLFFYFSNLAIPAKTSEKSGYCNFLKKEIKLTDTVSWPTLLASYPNLNFPKLDTNNFDNLMKKMQEIEIIKNQKVKYSETIFGIMESFLIDNMEATSL